MSNQPNKKTLNETFSIFFLAYLVFTVIVSLYFISKGGCW